MLEKIDWKKVNGLLPAIIQSSEDHSVLMLGYMNEEALQLTQELEQVCFYSRTKKRIWRKGESSGNVLKLVEMHLDCDGDTLLVRATPTGPVCHTGATNCFACENLSPHFLSTLESVIKSRIQNGHNESYTHSLAKSGAARVAQKVGEEAVEAAIASVSGNREEVIEESADLLFHMIVNLKVQGLHLSDVLTCLQKRHSDKVRG